MASEKRPNDELSEEIATNLTVTGLVSKTRGQELVKRLQLGNIKAADWTIWAEELVVTPDRVETEVKQNANQA